MRRWEGNTLTLSTSYNFKNFVFCYGFYFRKGHVPFANLFLPFLFNHVTQDLVHGEYNQRVVQPSLQHTLALFVFSLSSKYEGRAPSLTALLTLLFVRS
jgi:hypothetical protein